MLMPCGSQADAIRLDLPGSRAALKAAVVLSRQKVIK